MKQIPLTRGLVALVDDEDYEELMKYKWSADAAGYAKRCVLISSKPKKSRTIVMHRLLLGLEHGDPRRGDHEDLNKQNNQRYNLRIATHQENSRNVGINSKNTSGFKGVCWDSLRSKWKAQIKIDMKRRNLGRFDTPEEAYAAYCAAAVKLHGEFARTG